MFTGSTEVARLLQAELAGRLDARGRPPVLVAETGGQNALVVDSSALTEQVIADVVASAFDSAGQRCSALRLLCVQEDAAERTLDMLRGALRELRLGNPAELATDVGPVITEKARDTIDAHVAAMQEKGFAVERLPADLAALNGTFVPPTMIEIDAVSTLGREVFGPVLHVLRFRRDKLDRLIEAVNATGYALTFGLHTRIDETVERVTARAAAGNIYVNRNIIGAVVGVQPFGGHGLSGTGPKAGGPLYLYRLLADYPLPEVARAPVPPLAAAWAKHAAQKGIALPEADAPALVGLDLALPGPVGETNHYAVVPRGEVLCVAETPRGLALQVAAALRAGNRALVAPGAPPGLLDGLPADLAKVIEPVADTSRGDAVLIEGDDAAVRALAADLAGRPGAIVPFQAARTGDLDAPRNPWREEWLVHERAVSVNTAAAGGNASLMSIG
jgi:RHH-type proline utilization regulon transcriptional repressor/proline dehydrogenase/delta 1-pyrroline-5-carboxylate dehydrogenase